MAFGRTVAQGRGDILVGTWKLDVSKSKIDYGALPKSEVRTYAVTPSDGVRLTVQGIDGSGGTYSYTANGAIDGKDYPLEGAGTRNGGGRVSWSRINDRTIGAVVKKMGRIVNTTRLVVSSDRKLLTITENGSSPEGTSTHGVRVYLRQ